MKKIVKCIKDYQRLSKCDSVWNLIVNCKAGNWGADIPKPIPSFRLLVLSWPLWTLIVKSKRLVKPGVCWDIHRFPRPQMKNLGRKWKESHTIVTNFTCKTCFTTCMSLACRYIDGLSQCAILRHQPETIPFSMKQHVQTLLPAVSSPAAQQWCRDMTCWNLLNSNETRMRQARMRQGWDKGVLIRAPLWHLWPCWQLLEFFQEGAGASKLPTQERNGKEPISRLSRPALLDRIR